MNGNKNENARPKAPKQKMSKILKNNLLLLKKTAKLTPDYFILTFVEGVVWGIINSAISLFTVYLFDALDVGAPFSRMASIIGIMALFYIVAYAFSNWYWHYYLPLLKQKLINRLNSELFLKAHSLDVSCYDDPEFYNDFVWAMDEAGARANELLNDIGKLVNRVVAASTLFTLLFSIDTVVAVVLLISSTLSIVLNQIANKVSFEHQLESKPLARLRSYINRVFHLPDYSKEIRTSHVTDLLMDEMDRNTEVIIDTAVKYGKKYFVLWGICNTLLTNAVYFGIMFYMVARLLAGGVLIGGFTASVGMVWRVRWLLNDFVTRFAKFPKHSLFLEKYYGFLSYEPKMKSGEREVGHFESLELRDVSFAYDFSDNPRYAYHGADHKVKKNDGEGRTVLHNINLTLRRGEKIAIVGYNGAGKTTLIKLLMRLYDPSEGVVLLNGTDIKEYKLEQYRDCIGTVFQDYRIFAASIAENVMNGEYNEETDKATVLTALKAAGFSDKLSKLEHGIDTTLTREFDDKGTNLSGGEAQKVAIARVFAKPYELIIMDEPSSALDPVAEYELNRSILEYARDKTVIFISHRLSTTRMADRIYMFADGKIAEEGSHEQLMTLGGKYAEMFELQAEKYRSESAK